MGGTLSWGQGRVILGMFMSAVKEALELKYHVRLYVDHKYWLLFKKTYTCDETITALMQLTGRKFC